MEVDAELRRLTGKNLEDRPQRRREPSGRSVSLQELKDLLAAGCEVRGEDEVRALHPLIKPAAEADWASEYLDAIIAVMDAKYTYEFWRPFTAIRNGDIDGNPATERQADWLPRTGSYVSPLASQAVGVPESVYHPLAVAPSRLPP